MNKKMKKNSQKLKKMRDNRVNERARKRLKVEKVEDEVKRVIDTESEEDEVVGSKNNEDISNSDGDYENHSGKSDDDNVSDSDINEDGIDVGESEEDEEEEKTKIKRAKSKKKSKYDPEEEARLERLVFGDPSDVISNLLDAEVSTKKDDGNSVKNLPSSIDDSDDSDDDSRFEIKSGSEDDEIHASKAKHEVAWVDEADINYSIKTALRQQHRRLPGGRPEKSYTELLENKFTQIVGTPKWASLETPKSEGEDADLDDEILKRSNHLSVSKVTKLRKGKIDIKALTDINKSTGTEGPIVPNLEFHPTSTVAMVAGLSGILSIFQVDGRTNTKLQSIRFDKFPINCAKFLREGCEIILGSRHCSYSQAYDLMSGKTYKIPLPHGITNMQKFEVSPDGKFIAVVGRMGQIHLLSSATKELVADFKMNSRCLALAFSPDTEKLISHGESDRMYVWDLKNRRCVHKPNDDGCIASSAVAFSPSGQFLATGSKQGVVNVYDAATVMGEQNPKPLKIVLNLVTSITKLKFNPTSEILAIASKFKENAFRMLHIPSFTVFPNFPTFQTKIHSPLDMDFSPSSGYLGLSNDKGHAYLYRLKHYGNY